MDGDASTLLGACLLAFLLILNFIMTAFSAAIRSVSDTEIQEAFESEGKPPDEICELKDHSDRLIHTIWLLTGHLHSDRLFSDRTDAPVPDLCDIAVAGDSVLSVRKFYTGDART